MKMGMRRARDQSALLFLLGLLLFAGCGAGTRGQIEGGPAANGNRSESGKKIEGREVALGERFTVTPDEKVSVKDTRLTLQLKTVRRSWLVGGGSEIVDAQILITLDGEERTEWLKLGEKVTVGDYSVELTSAYPFVKTSAGLVVSREGKS